ncbi:right-handed parallel beta-helix repeat-containing protein [Cellulomonas biazotea]|uniref:Right handed beta helix domain-containing protein n=1 Tax=Cellulomonas biazotea TaxID=1709 RepID=A0A402DTS7_9CELL|nr:right-handed parallel beta-helix repeat-containing protein [Cellulomonas biazotea]GCE77533.1 hypothetical protein CBZ_25890 [Cellulomonas biazotea]
MRARAVLTVLSVLTVVTTTVAVAAPAGAAPPPRPACGDTLTVDTRLRADLVCDGAGLRVGPGVTLDLGGHTVRGSGAGVGVAVASEGTVRVRNGTLAGWGEGIATYAVPDTDTGPLVVDRVRFTGNVTGLLASGEDGTGLYGKDATVTRSTFRDNTWGLLALWHIEVDVQRTTFASNGTGVEAGDSQVDVAGSRFARNDVAMSLGQSGTTITGTTFVDNPRGLTVAPTSGATVTGSTFVGSDVAVAGYGNPTVLHIDGNRFTDNGTAVSFDLSDGSVTGNTFRGNGTGLLVVQAPWDVTLVQDNTFVRGGDGIRVEQGDALLQLGGNDARRNSGWGILAPDVTDLGGNTARGNGNEPQCVGVVCGTS